MEQIPENKIKTFVDLAESGTDEGWEEIDRQLPEHCNDPELFNWARENTENPNSELRDLAATIFEASDTELNSDDIENLTTLMRSDDTENPYPSFRSACALSKRASRETMAIGSSLLLEIKKKLEEFTEDEDVSEIAKSYLKSPE